MLWALWWFLFLSEKIHCSQLEHTSPLLDSIGPKYYGLMNPREYRFEIDYFTRYSFVDFNTPTSEAKTDKFFSKLDDDVVIYILSFLDDFRLLNKLLFASKRLFTVLSKYVALRFSAFNPQIFWILPPSSRLFFGLKFLKQFEKEFQGIKRNVLLTRDELCGLILLSLHIENPYYISRSNLNYIRVCNPNYFITDNDSLQIFPFPTPGVWKVMLLSRYITKDSFFCIEAACTADPSKINWVIELITQKLGILEKKRNTLISDEMRFLLYQIITLSSDFKTTLSYLLFKSVVHETLSTFVAFLPLWTDPINQLIPSNQRNHFEVGEDHIIYRIAYGNLACPELLKRTDLTEENLAASLKLCKDIGNWKMATELITTFPPNIFSLFFDPDHINLLRDALLHPNETIDLQISLQSQLKLALLIASFHFPHPQVISLFNIIIENQNRLPKGFLKELKSKRTSKYYDLAVNNQRTNRFCCMS